MSNSRAKELIKVTSRNILSRMLELCINIYPKSFLRYKFLISTTNHLDTFEFT